ncbi:MAG: hypothetical protein F6K09_18755 [Merismopedia sp. SIO2A8]|nr:hypothetical protein [Merismopedia sp. SIO2A8]
MTTSQQAIFASSYLARLGELERAQAIAETIIDTGKQTFIIVHLIHGMASHEDFATAFALLDTLDHDRFQPMAPNIIQQMPNVGSNIQEVIYELVEQGQLAQALQVAEAADDPFTRSILKMTVVFKSMEAGDFEAPVSILDQVLVDMGIEE